MSFIANPPDPASPEGANINGDGFFPDIDFNNMRDAMRVGTNVPDKRLVGILQNAWNHIADQLWLWRIDQEEKGHEKISDVNGRKIGEQNRLEFLFIRAVQYSAEAEIYDSYNDISATGKNEDLSETKRMSADDYRRNAIHTVRDITGQRRTMIGLV